MPDLNIKLNYIVRLTIKRTAAAVDAYTNLPFFSLWDLVNFSKKREDKKTKDQFRRLLSQVKGFLSDILDASKVPEDVEDTMHVTCNRLYQIADISDTDRDILEQIEVIRCALTTQQFKSKLEVDAIKTIELYYALVWQIAQSHEVSAVREARPATSDLKAASFVCLQSLQTQSRYTQYHPPLDALEYHLGALHLDKAAEMLPVREASRVPMRRYREPALAQSAFYQEAPQRVLPYGSEPRVVREQPERSFGPSFFKRSPASPAPQVLLQQPIFVPVQITDESVRPDRKRNLEARDGTTLEIRRSEHQKKKLKVDSEEASSNAWVLV